MERPLSARTVPSGSTVSRSKPVRPSASRFTRSSQRQGLRRPVATPSRVCRSSTVSRSKGWLLRIGKCPGDLARHPHLGLVGPPRRPTGTAHVFIDRHEHSPLGVCAISRWEVVKRVERGRLRLPMPTSDWLHAALAYPGVRLRELSPDVAAEACSLPGDFHADPADQIIVATARHHGVGPVTLDERILRCSHVEVVGVKDH